MIAHLRGRLLEKHANRAVLDVNGVGYEVVISVPTYSALGAAGTDVALHVHTHVREDALALYGFFSNDEKRLFERLIGVSGIGPKLAITILSGMEADALVAALRANDVARLTRIPGIGKKTAERMVLELRDKLEAFAPGASAPSPGGVEEEVVSALVNLGYQRPAAEKALTAAAKNGAALEFDSLLRAALGQLSK